MLIVLGVVTGVLAALLGIGGGLLMVPALTVLGVPLVEATATSLVAVFLSAVSGSWQNLQMGVLDWRTALGLALFGIVTAQAGAWLGDRLPDAALSIAFAGFLVLTLYLMVLKQQLQQKSMALSPPARRTDQLWAIAAIGTLAGGLAGLFGVGGGMVMVPLQMLFLGEPIKSAVRTSLGAIVAIAASGLVQHSLNQNVLWIPGLCLGGGGILGAQLGSRLLPRLSDRTVNRLFRLFLLGMTLYMLMRGLLKLF